MLLLILRHIELEQGLLAAEPAGGKGLGKGGLAHAGGPQKNMAPMGRPGSPSPVRLRRMALATAATAFCWPTISALRRDSSLSSRSRSFSPTRSTGTPLACATTRAMSSRVRVGSAFPLPLGADAGSGTGLVHKVDGLIGQEAPRQVPHRELHGLPQRLGRQMHAVVALVAGASPSRIAAACAGVGSSICTRPKRRSSAASFWIWVRNS